MEGTDSGPSSFRASDADRERALRLLRDSAVEGRLSHESFVHRVDLALRARDQPALRRLLADLPAGTSHRLLATVRTSISEIAQQLASAGRTPRNPVLGLPGPHQPVLVIGRDGDCDVVFPDLTVSRRHAVLRRFGDRWFLDDLGSTNGTRLNGVRIRRATQVDHGDLLGLGAVVVRIEARRRARSG